jgi:hypothetical protein
MATSVALRASGQGDAASDLLGERKPRLGLELAQLLRDARRGSVGGLGHLGDASSLGEFAQQIESSDVHGPKFRSGKLDYALAGKPCTTDTWFSASGSCVPPLAQRLANAWS